MWWVGEVSPGPGSSRVRLYVGGLPHLVGGAANIIPHGIADGAHAQAARGLPASRDTVQELPATMHVVG